MAIINTNDLLADLTFANYEYQKAFPRWQLIHDIYTDAIIADETVFRKYVVIPYSGKSYTGTTAETVLKLQSDFFKGADLTNVLARTVNVMNGSVKVNDADLRLSGLAEGMNLKPLITNIKQSLFDTTLYSRSGILVSAPDTEDELTVQDVRDGLGASINTYHAWQIMDWDESETGELNYVVLAEPTIIKSVDDLGNDAMQIQYRVVYRDEGGNIWIRVIDSERTVITDVPVVLSNGTASKEFPFKFIGAFVNIPKINDPVFYAMAKKNSVLLSYSAHANQSMRSLGSPILYIAPNENMSDSFGTEINAGGITGYNVGHGGTVGFAQPSPNTLAVDGKERQIDELIKMGARLVTDNAANQTAEAARIQHSGDLSMIQTVINNVSMAYTQALRLLADYQGVPWSDEDDSEQFIGLELSDDVIDSKVEATMIQAITAGVSNAVIPPIVLYNSLMDGGFLPEAMTFEEFEESNNAQGLGLPDEPVEPVAGDEE